MHRRLNIRMLLNSYPTLAFALFDTAGIFVGSQSVAVIDRKNERD
jgi:hypothetical protein